jgi:hypothetical protein
MRNRLVVLAMSLLGLVGMLALAASADAGGKPLSTALTGAEEAPSSGDPNATGQADLRLNQGQEEICFDISWADVDGEVFAAHIHVGPPGDSGPIVVPLFEGSFAGTGSVSDCVDVDKALVKTIRQNAEDYYVNVHSRPNFPAGAIRGQLGD